MVLDTKCKKTAAQDRSKRAAPNEYYRFKQKNAIFSKLQNVTTWLRILGYSQSAIFRFWANHNIWDCT
jgi:hypothetical protein